MRPVARQAAESNDQVLFLPGIFNETLALLFDAHHYFQSRGGAEQASIEEAARPFYASEMTRVTLRLTSVMAWIMVRRAIYAGRIEEEKAQDSYRLEATDVCREHQPEVLAHMPYYLTHLSEESHALYERVFRLDSMAYGERPALAL